jgi:hypothetical protein
MNSKAETNAMSTAMTVIQSKAVQGCPNQDLQ